MNLIHIRYRDSLASALAEIRDRHERFRRLLGDRRTGIRIAIRQKKPEVDLKLNYNRRLAQTSASSIVLVLGIMLLYPEHHPTVYLRARPDHIIQLQNIPETSQQMRPPAPPRPSVPLAVEGEDIPDDVTIESTELDLDRIPMDLRIRGPVAIGPPSDEAMDGFDIEHKPHPIRIVTPEYPAAARRAKQEGTVVVRVLVTREGQVERVEVMDGPEAFVAAAVAAARQFRFRPGRHEGVKRKVWMVMPIDFKLK